LKKRRFQWVTRLLNHRNLDGLLVTSPENVRYWSGFTGSDAALLFTGDRRRLLTDSRYITQAADEASGYELAEYSKKVEGIADAILASRVKRLGFESEHVTYAFWAELSAKLTGIALVPLEREVRAARIRKDPSEIRLMKKAISIAEKALLNTLCRVEPGIAEKELAREIEFEMRRLGAETVAFETIVASGYRAALPHGKPTEKRLKRGDLLLIDFGSRFNGYHSDETCTFCLGEPTAEQRKIYSIVKEAHDRAISSIRAGVSLQEIDRVARGYIADKGYGARFGHGLGHGVGLAIHEEPRISFDSEGVAEGGMVFTVEPGIYIPGWGGIRIEDMVLVRKEECEVLTQIDKGLRVF